MLVGKNYKLESDANNIVLSQKRKRTSRNGKTYEVWDIMGYFSTLQGALIELVNQKVRDTQLKDLKTIMAELDFLERLIIALPKHLQMPPNNATTP